MLLAQASILLQISLESTMAGYAANEQAWLLTILDSKEVFSRVCLRTFRRVDVDGKSALDLAQVRKLVQEVSAQLGLDPPTMEKVHQFFKAVDKSETNTLLPNEFNVFFKGLLKNMSQQSNSIG